MSDSDPTAPQPLGPQAHGGDLDRARARYGGAPTEWLDLSTGINAAPYPWRAPDPAVYARLPGAALADAAIAAARAAYGVPQEARIVAAPGAQAVIDALPRALLAQAAGRVAVLGPTYSEFERAFARAGWRVEPVTDPDAPQAAAADALVIVNPNNPTGGRVRPEALRALLRSNRALILDESFVDAEPDLSLAAEAGRQGLVILRSFGKFYGLAGLRLGFGMADPTLGARLAAELGPWPASGPALAIGAEALGDDAWRAATTARLWRDAERLDGLAEAAGWRLLGGAALFRSYICGDGAEIQERFASRRIWTRRFEAEPSWIRLGLPADAAGWARLEAALAEIAP